MSARLRVSGSSLDRVMNCPASVVLPHTREETPAAAAGTRLHRFLQVATERGRDEALEDVGDAEEREAFAGIDLGALPVGSSYAAEVAIAINPAAGTARELGRGLDRDVAYHDVNPVDEIPLTIDVVGVAPDHVFCVDWKRGMSAPPARRNWQVRAAAYGASLIWDRPAARAAVIQRAGSRSPDWSVVELDVFELAEIGGQLRGLRGRIAYAMEAVIEAKRTDVFHVGGWCKWCPAFLSCPAQTALIRRIAGGEELDSLGQMVPLTRETAGEAYRRLRVAKSLLARVEAAVFASVIEFGSVPIGDGLELREVERKGNEQLDAATARAVLTELFGGDVANAASKFEVSKAGIGRALRAYAGGNPIAADEKRALKLIAERGGVSRRASTRQVKEVEVE